MTSTSMSRTRDDCSGFGTSAEIGLGAVEWI